MAEAGLVSGPRMLKTVRTPISRRSGAANFIAGWNDCANRKPTPVRSMQLATWSGVSAISAPSASSRSAEPDCDVIARLPCFATFAPAAAATKAAAVETLNAPSEEPPVPQVSSSGREGTCTFSECSRMTRAIPTTSSTVSPLCRSATTKAPNCAAVASASMISPITAAASSSLRSRPSSTSAAIASRITPASPRRAAPPSRGSCAADRGPSSS